MRARVDGSWRIVIIMWCKYRSSKRSTSELFQFLSKASCPKAIVLIETELHKINFGAIELEIGGTFFLVQEFHIFQEIHMGV
jgi:hypothetical protein